MTDKVLKCCPEWSCWELPEVLAELVEFRLREDDETFDELWNPEDWDKMWSADYEGPADDT